MMEIERMVHIPASLGCLFAHSLLAFSSYLLEIDAITRNHFRSFKSSSASLKQTMARFDSLGIDINFTLDINGSKITTFNDES